MIDSKAIKNHPPSLNMAKSHLLNGDCLVEMKKIPTNSVDAIITDPPYGYGFMCKPWDMGVPSVAIWIECLRILKPGAFMFVMSAPRLDVQTNMVVNIREAGFKISFSPIYWTYASGMTKAQNISKAIDLREFQTWCKQQVVFFPYLYQNLKQLKGLKPIWAREIKQEYQEIEYEHPGRKNRSYQTTSEIFSQDRKNNRKDTITQTLPITPNAKKYNGFYGGFQTKPAVEVIIVVQKPNSESTNIDQVVLNQKGGTYLDRGRIPTELTRAVKNSQKGYMTPSSSGIYGFNKKIEKEIKKMVGGRGKQKITTGMGSDEYGYKVRIPKQMEEYCDVDLRGGFPANLLVSDEILGDYSKFFSLDEWVKDQIAHIPKAQQKTYPFLYVPKAYKTERNKGLDHCQKKKVTDGRTKKIDMPHQRGETERKNTHPTVKPVSLFTYLIALSPTQPGDMIVDPFGGSGTTGIAAKMTDRKYICIEFKKKYFNIMKQRIAAYRTQKSLLAFCQ